MLESTFQHIPGVGPVTEKRLWREGFHSWGEYVDNGGSKPYKAVVLESLGRLEAGDHCYFRDRLGSHLTWRAFNPFRGDACFLDIETTGLSPVYDTVTTVCLHSSKGTRSYVAGENMKNLRNDLHEFKYIVSFNGGRFDLPFLSKSLNMGFHQIHLDLMYPLRHLGYSGGLKSIEKQLGVSRGSDGVSGYDAVRLWKAYTCNRTVEVAGEKYRGKQALKKLVAYNRDDTVNLEKIADFVVAELEKECRVDMEV